MQQRVRTTELRPREGGGTMRPVPRPPFPCVALLLQGGGSLGAYQGGVYQALAEADLHPDWVAGISIGAVNAAFIAGNALESLVVILRDFWEDVSTPPLGCPASRFDRHQGRCHPSRHQPDACVRHHVVRRTALLHA